METTVPSPCENRLGLASHILERFFAKVDKNGPGGCWQWKASLDGHGYGQFWILYPDGKRCIRRAHRIMYELCFGPLSDELQLHHTCENKICCNPNHVEPVTPKEHTLRTPQNPWGLRANQTYCVKGHPLFGPNLRINKRGQRQCKKCDAILHAAHYSTAVASATSAQWRAIRKIRRGDFKFTDLEMAHLRDIKQKDALDKLFNHGLI